jgi:hypothetical protein
MMIIHEDPLRVLISAASVMQPGPIVFDVGC